MVGIFQLWYKRQGIVPFHNQYPTTLCPLASICHCSPSEGHRYHPKKFKNTLIASSLAETMNAGASSINFMLTKLLKLVADGWR